MKKIMILLFLSVVLGGCSHTTPLKAPCNWSGNNCHPRILINQWDQDA